MWVILDTGGKDAIGQMSIAETDPADERRLVKMFHEADNEQYRGRKLRHMEIAQQ